jgi:hypothetical protein
VKEVDSTTAARGSSRFSRARLGRRYLPEITSPCSVSLISPCNAPTAEGRRVPAG